MCFFTKLLSFDLLNVLSVRHLKVFQCLSCQWLPTNRWSSPMNEPRLFPELSILFFQLPCVHSPCVHSPRCSRALWSQCDQSLIIIAPLTPPLPAHPNRYTLFYIFFWVSGHHRSETTESSLTSAPSWLMRILNAFLSFSSPSSLPSSGLQEP